MPPKKQKHFHSLIFRHFHVYFSLSFKHFCRKHIGILIFQEHEEVKLFSQGDMAR